MLFVYMYTAVFRLGLMDCGWLLSSELRLAIALFHRFASKSADSPTESEQAWMARCK